MPFLRRLSLFAGASAAAVFVPAFAANLPPEPTQALHDVTLEHGAAAAPIPLADHFRDPDVPGSAARITVRLGSETRIIDLALFDTQTPLTVANFLAYVDAGSYAANFFHRSVPGFIIQNGGFRFLSDTTPGYVPAFAAVANEPGISNVRGTIAMAKLGGDPNSATSQWFINLADNSANLDAQNGGFTVFGRVLGDGMAVADAIAAVPHYDVSSYASAWTDLPLTAAFLARANFIETNIARIAPLSFTVVSDDPALVSASITNGVLAFAAAPDRSGETTLHLTATDLDGAILAASFTVTVPFSAQTVEVTAPSGKTYGDAPFSLPATASSGLTSFAVEVLSGPATAGPDGQLTLTGAGDVSVRVTQPGNALYAPAGVTVSFSVARASQTIEFAELADQTTASPAITLSAAASSGLPVAFAVSGPATLSGNTLTLTGATGTVTITASQPGNASYLAATAVARSFTVASASPTQTQTIATVTLHSQPIYGGAPVRITATASSGLPVVFELVSTTPAGIATLETTVEGATLTVTGTGNIILRATQPGDATYLPVISNISLSVAKAAQTIEFGGLPDKAPASSAFTVSAVASSGLPVAFTVSGPATLSGNTVTLTGALGTVTVTASQSGNENYLAAADVSQSFTVATAQTISFTQVLGNRVATASPVVLAATASSGLPVGFSASGPASIGPDGKTLTLTGQTGTVTVTASQPGGERAGIAYVSATPVVKTFEVFLTAPTQAQTLTFAQPAAVTYGHPPLELTATASSGLPAAFEILSSTPAGIASLEASTLTIVGAGKIVLRASQPGDATFKPATAITRTLTVDKAPLTVKANDQSRLVGAANPGFTLSYTASDFVNGDTEADLASTRPVAKTKATPKSAQGDYAITVSGGSDANYTFVAANPPGLLHVLGFGGTYEALLVDDALTPLGKLTLTVSNSALSYSGTVTLASAAKATAFKSTANDLLVPQADGSSAAGDLLITLTTADPNVLYDRALDFTLSSDGTLTGGLFPLGQGGIPSAIISPLSGGARVAVFAKGESAPDAGANTLVLHPPVRIDEGDTSPLPGGSGYATASIASSSGVLTLKGKLADGQPLTASLKPTRLGEAPPAYLLWTNPYGTRTESFLAGRLALQEHPDQTRFPGRFYIPSEAGLLVWQKASLPESTSASKRDKTYRAGFGPLGVPVSLDPWLPPSTKAVTTNGVTIPAGTLVQRLGLADDTPPGVFAIAYGPESLDLGDSGNTLPTSATLATSGSLTVTGASATSWTIKLTPATGVFSGSFVLHDQVNPAPAKPTTRTVAFSGTLRQTPVEDDTVLGTGFFLLPGFATTDEQPSGEIRFSAPAP